MTKGAFTPVVPKGHKKEQERIDLIVMLDEEYNILMKMEILPVAQLTALHDRAAQVGLTNLAAKIKKELGLVDNPQPA